MTQVIYNIFDAAKIAGDLSVNQVWAGLAAEGVDTSSGLLTFYHLPGIGTNFADGLTVSNYQIDIWHSDIFQAETIKEEAERVLLGKAEIIDGVAYIFNIASDLGGFFEENGAMWHYSFTVSVRYNKR